MATAMDDRSAAAKWAEAARGGSLEALGELYRTYADMVYGLARNTTGSREEAEEVLQDVFVGLPHALRNYKERGAFEAWLKRLVVRAALMRMRAVRRKREIPLDATGECGHADAGASPAAVASPPHPLDRLTLQRAIERLPDPLRVVFVLREIEGFTHGEIAGMLGITSGNSATRLSRAWAILRKEARR